MNKFIILISLLLIINKINSESSQDHDVYDFEYAIGSNENFEKLTTINLRKLKEHHSAYLSSSLQSSSLNVYSSIINPTIKNRLLNELKSSTYPIYRVRLCKKSSCSPLTYTSIKNLLSSNNIQLNLSIHLNSNNNINSITIQNDNKISSNNNQLLDDNEYHLTINANLVTLKSSNAPDTQTYVEKVRREIEATKESSKDNNKSFFSKYWYYIVPFAVIVFLSSVAQPEQGGEGGAQ